MVPFLYHWNVGAGDPSAVAIKVTLPPVEIAPSVAVDRSGHCAAIIVSRVMNKEETCFDSLQDEAREFIAFTSRRIDPSETEETT